MAFTYQTYILSPYSLTTILVLLTLIASSSGQFPPKLLPKQSSDDNRRIIKSGSSISLHCPVEKSEIDDNYFEWIKDGKPVEYFDDRIRMTNNGVLKIRHSVSEDTGRFMCKAINGFGSVEFSVTLIVLDEDYEDSIAEKDQIKPIHELDSAIIPSKSAESGSKPQLIQVSKFPQHVIQRQTKSGIRFKCVVSGNPKPTITWFHNNDQLTDSESKKGRFSLVINDLKPEDSGNYTCLSSNPFGTITHSYILQVIDRFKNKPEIQGSHPMNTTVISGSTATFQCSIKSDEVPHIQWLKKQEKSTFDDEDEPNNLNSAKDEPHLIEFQGEFYKTLESTEAIQSSEGLFFNKLVIINAKEEDAGKYLCRANTLGSNFRSAFLSVFPSKQKQTHFYSITKHDIFPTPIVIALVSVAIIILIAIMFWIFSCYCQKQEPNTRTNQSSYYSPSKHSRSSLPVVEQNTTYNQVLTNKYHNKPSNDLRASSPFYSELITSDKRQSNVYQLYTNPADIKPNHYQSHKPYGYLC